MANIFDYLDWRGDITFKKSRFNEIDNIILARFSYFDLNGLLEDNEVITIKEANERFIYSNCQNKVILQKLDVDLLYRLANSKRYANIKVTRYVNKIDVEGEKQFCAVCLILPDNNIYVSYRGTDNTLVGWKEDFNMSFKECVPAQKMALEYLEEIVSKYDEYDIMVGGHSKGGNLAIFAAINLPDELKSKITFVFNNDGPGFDEEVIKGEKYRAMESRICTYIPQTSIVGRLMFHGDHYQVVKSTEVGLKQHDLYSWQVLGTKFVYLDDLDQGSYIIDNTVSDWLTKVDKKQREEFVEILFNVLSSADVSTVPELKSNWLKNGKKVLEGYKNIAPENKEILEKTLKMLVASGTKTIKNKIPTFTSIKNKLK